MVNPDKKDCMQLEIVKMLKVGDKAPDFNLPTGDG
jgi:hypothetical protein